MKWALMTSVAIGLGSAAIAQTVPDTLIAQQREAMKAFAKVDGLWRGPAVTQTPSGTHNVTQTERIGSFLDGTVKVIEGHGFMADGRPGFHAFGIISYNPQSAKYEFRSYAQGYSGTFEMIPTSTGYVWEIPSGPGSIIRYTATIGEKNWREIGERIVGAGPPQKFFEMNLVKVGSTDWPAAGGMTAK